MPRRHSPPPDALGYLLTWTTYGTWMPGDSRGWVKSGHGFQPPDMRLVAVSLAALAEPPITFDAEMRAEVEAVIERHCAIRKWTLHARNCRTNHVHVVASGPAHPDRMRDEFKAWGTRILKALQARRGISPTRRHWWTEGGSDRWLFDDDSLHDAIVYVRDGQDHKGERAT